MTREEAKQNTWRAHCNFDDPRKAIHIVIDQIFDYFGEQLQAKDEEIEGLGCRAYHAEGYINDLHNNPKDKKFYDKKARSIVAMLFWEWRRLETEGITEEAFAARNCFYKAYALLKDKLINSLHQMCEDFEEEGKNKDKKIRLLTELKSCEGCKYLYINQYTEFVDYCTELGIEISCSNISTFCCNRYEAKDS